MTDELILTRITKLEKETHTLLFRMEQLDRQRLPDRLIAVEAAMANLDDKLSDIKSAVDQINNNVRAVRNELNADVNNLSEAIDEKIIPIRSRQDQFYGKITGVVVTMTVVSAVLSFLIVNWGTFANILGGTP